MNRKSLSNKQLQAILNLNATERYKHTIKQIVGWNEVWGLYDQDWALLEDNGSLYFPIWPAEEYAALCATGRWGRYSPKNIDLGEFFGKIVPHLIDEKKILSVFITPTDPGFTPDYEEFSGDVSEELDKY